MRVTTESGSVYEFSAGWARRVNDSAEKRADGLWVRVLSMYPPTPVVGQSLLLMLEPLGRFGPDDSGNTGPVTARTTTRVTAVTE